MLAYSGWCHYFHGILRKSLKLKLFFLFPTKMKQCPICQQKIDLSKFAEHVANCNGSVVSRSTAVAKKCSVCRQDIPETEFVNHITNCRGQATPQNVRQVKKCITCGRDIRSDEYVNHVSYCNGRNITR